MSPSSFEEGREETDRLLRGSAAVPERSAAAKADTWYRLRGEVLEGKAAEPRTRLFVRWPVLFAYACVAALIAGGLYGWIGGGQTRNLRPPPAAARVAPEVAIPAPVTPPAPVEIALQPGWRRVDLGAVGQLTVSASASLRLPANEASPSAPYTVGLDSGELCAAIAHRDVQKQGPFVVEAASLRVVVVGTRFCVSAGETTNSSWVSVEEGQVRVERNGRSAFVSTGETLHGGDPQLLPPRIREGAPSGKVAVASNSDTCPETTPLPARRRCLWRLAGGDDLAAQNALYLLGSLAKDQEHDGVAALSIWQTYRHRFARGVMTAEVDLAIFNELLVEARFGEALDVSDDFLAQFPTYFHAGEVRLKRADLLRTRLKRIGDAEDGYRSVLSTASSPVLRSEALFGLGSCQEALGLASDARTTWNRYQMEYPQGRRISEVTHRLGGSATGP